MSIDKEIKKGITKGDIILVAFLVALCAVLFAFSFTDENDILKAEIYLGGEKVQETVLSDMDESRRLKVGGCELLIEKDGIAFISSQCEDQLCVKKGKLTRKGDAMACVPEKVVVNIKSLRGAMPDGITY